MKQRHTSYLSVAILKFSAPKLIVSYGQISVASTASLFVSLPRLLYLPLRLEWLRREERRRGKERNRGCVNRNEKTGVTALSIASFTVNPFWLRMDEQRREDEGSWRWDRGIFYSSASIDNDHVVNQCPIRGAFKSISLKISVSTVFFFP